MLSHTLSYHSGKHGLEVFDTHINYVACRTTSDGYNSALENNGADPIPQQTHTEIHSTNQPPQMIQVHYLCCLTLISLYLFSLIKDVTVISNYDSISSSSHIQKWSLVWSPFHWRCLLSSRRIHVLTQSLEQYCHGPRSHSCIGQQCWPQSFCICKKHVSVCAISVGNGEK